MDKEFYDQNKQWSWEDLVQMTVELICINSVETYLDEYDRCNGPMGSIEFIMEREYEMMKENLDDDINKMWDEIKKKVIETIKKEGYEV